MDNSEAAYYWERKSRTRTPTGEDIAGTAELVAKTTKTKARRCTPTRARARLPRCLALAVKSPSSSLPCHGTPSRL